MKEVTIFFDGGIRKGRMALGFVAYDMDGQEIFCGNRFCGKIESSSNVAEYRAVIAAIQKSIEKNVKIIHIIGDSQLIIKQITGAFKVNKPILLKHRDHAIKLLEQFDDYTIMWVPRKQNRRADELVNDVFERNNVKCTKKK